MSVAATAALLGCTPGALDAPAPETIGVIYVFHGGSERFSPEASWNSTMQIFGYDPNSVVYKNVIWNPEAWPRLLGFGNAPKEQGKYTFEFARIGGIDPAERLTRQRFEQLRDSLERRERVLGVDFIVDYASWLSQDPRHHIHPRSLYTSGLPGGAPLTYCGSRFDGGVPPDDRWAGCDPERYNTDGTLERMLKQNVDRIVIIDMTTSGVRFFKTFNIVDQAQQLVAIHNAHSGARVELVWANDPTGLMAESYPIEPPGWTISLGKPAQDRSVPLTGRPNPVSSDPRLAGFHADGIEAEFASGVTLKDTGVLLVNHATRKHNQYFDPKIDDTVVLNENIKQTLLARHPQLKATNIVGAWMGRKEINPNSTSRNKRERTRRMRGENLGEAWLYETDEQLPGAPWGYRYWAALDELKNNGVKHIVIAFPQIMVDSVLNLVELPNQIAKEIGYRNWVYIDSLDFDTYPDVGHPFADYWGVWVDTECGAVSCCFTMGGCDDGRRYPPPRQTPSNKSRDDLDPSLAFDVSEFGHLGYDPARGKPNATTPVQDQYRGSWAIWRPPNDDPGVAEFLADKVVEVLN